MNPEDYNSAQQNQSESNNASNPAQKNQSESNNAFNPIHFYFPWPKRENKTDEKGNPIKDKDGNPTTYWTIGQYGQKEKDYTWFTACGNFFFRPLWGLVSSTNQRQDDDRNLEDITTPKSLRLMMISIVIIFGVSLLQFSWSAGYHDNWQHTADNIRENLIPTLLPPNADNIKWQGDPNYATVANKYSDMLLGFSNNVNVKVLDLKSDNTETADAQRRALHVEAATNLAKYLDTTCFPLYDMVLHQNFAIYICSLIFWVIFGVYLVCCVLSHSTKFCNTIFNNHRNITQKLEATIIVLLFFAEIIIIAFGLSSIFFLAYQDYSVTLWTRQNNDYSTLNTAYTPKNLARISASTNNAIMPTERFNAVSARASSDYRCFNLHKTFDHDDSTFKTQMDTIYNKKTNSPQWPNVDWNECSKDNLENSAVTQCKITFEKKYLPFQKIPPAIPKLHWDIIIAGVVLVLSIMRNIVLAMEYTANSNDATSTNQMYGGLGVRAAVPQASYAYAPPGVFVMQ